VEPQLTDARGDADPGGFASLVQSVERARGLHFVRWPMLVVMDPGAPELAALERQARAFMPLPEAEGRRSLPSGAQAGKTGTRDATPGLAAAAFPDFERAYSEDGLMLDEFETFPCSRRTLRQFIAGCAEMNAIVRDIVLPNPDTE